MSKKKEDSTIEIVSEPTMSTTSLDISDIKGMEDCISALKIGIDTVEHHSKEAAARATDSRDMTEALRREIATLINVVNDVDFRRTEFELGDIVLAKNPDMKRYKRGKIVGFGTSQRILVATMFSHLIATESDTFLIKRRSKGGHRDI